MLIMPACKSESTLNFECVTANMPLIIEVINEQSKLETLLSDLKKIGGNFDFVYLFFRESCSVCFGLLS
jgi:PII-like signaling protein